MTAVAECSGQNSVVLCDRGLMDSYAYCAPGGFDAAMQELNLNVEKCRDSRYESVIFLVSAADGAEEFYQTANNEARHETADVARHLDKKLQEGWIGHPKLKLIKNDKSFARKVRTLRFVDEPLPLSCLRPLLLLLHLCFFSSLLSSSSSHRLCQPLHHTDGESCVRRVFVCRLAPPLKLIPKVRPEIFSVSRRHGSACWSLYPTCS